MTVTQSLITLSEAKIGQVLDLTRHALKKAGVTDDDLQRLAEDGGRYQEAYTVFVGDYLGLGKEEAVETPALPPPILDRISFEVTAEDSANLPDKGWKPVKKEWVQDADGPVTIMFPLVHLDGEDYIDGETLLSRSKANGQRYGLRAANALVRQQQHIPVELRGQLVFVFTGAVATDPRRYRLVALVFWDGDRWLVDWGWHGSGDWARRYRPVQPSA